MQITDIPISLYKHFYLEEKYGFNKMTLKLFVTDQIKFLGFAQGIRKVSNMGRGDMLKIEWYHPLSRK